MKYDHIVKFNGVYYMAGSEVPEPANSVNENVLPVEKNSEKNENVLPVEQKQTSKRGRPAKQK